MENSNDCVVNKEELHRICQILLERNTLQRARHRARRQYAKYSNAVHYKQAKSRYDSLIKDADPLRNKDLKAINSIFTVLGGNARATRYPFRDVATSLFDAKQKIVTDIDNNKIKLEQAYKPNKNRLSNKLISKSYSELLILQKKSHCVLLQSQIALHEHAAKFTQELKVLLAKNSLRAYCDGSNIYHSLWVIPGSGKDKFIGQTEIEKLGAIKTFEDVVLT